MNFFLLQPENIRTRSNLWYSFTIRNRI